MKTFLLALLMAVSFNVSAKQPIPPMSDIEIAGAKGVIYGLYQGFEVENLLNHWPWQLRNTPTKLCMPRSLNKTYDEALRYISYFMYNDGGRRLNELYAAWTVTIALYECRKGEK